MSCKSCACNAQSNFLFVPARGPWDELRALGVRRTCRSDGLSVKVDCPPDWTIQPSQVSPFHSHLCDASGKAVACLFSKPGSGGAGSFQMTQPDNCAEESATGSVK